MKTGRNDPCPCGSGKKYKKCCLADAPAREPSPAIDDDADERARVRHGAIRAISSFASRPQFREARDEALRMFAGGHTQGLADGDGSAEADLEVKFASFFMFDQLLPDGRSIAECFLTQPVQPLAVKQQRLLRRFAGARLRPYEVQEVRLDEGLRLRDLWSDEEVVVAERAGTHQLQRWDVLAARVAPDEGGALRLEGGIYVLPISSKAALLKAIRAEERRLRGLDPTLDDDGLFRRCAPLVHRFWLDHVVARPQPTMVTAEGDPMVFGKLVFDVVDETALRSALARHPDLVAEDDGRYGWTERAAGFTRSLGHIEVRDGRRLVLEVTSRQRAERGRKLLEEAAGAALRHRSTRLQSVAKALERHRSSPPPETPDPIPPAVAADLIRQYKDRHYRSWPDEPLPALDGHTARQAAAIKRLRPRLVDLLKDMENHESRAARPDHPPYDFGWIWEELGLERPT